MSWGGSAPFEIALNLKSEKALGISQFSKLIAVWECHPGIFRPSPSGPIFPELDKTTASIVKTASHLHRYSATIESKARWT